MEKVRLGQITAPVGIKGEIRVFPYTDRNTRFSDIKKVFVGEGNDVYDIERYRSDKGMIVIKFAQVSDRNTSETLRGKYLYALKEDYKLEKDRYFTDDLLGISVNDEQGNKLGVLKSVIQGAAQDIYEIEKDDKKTFLVPAVKEFIVDVDVDNKKMVIHVIEGLTD